MKPEAKNVKIIRELYGLSQIDFAKKIGVSTGLIGQIETGAREVSRKTAFKIAEQFGIDPEILYQEDMVIPKSADPFKSESAVCYLVAAKALASVPGVYVPDSNSIEGEIKLPGLPERKTPYLAIQVEGPSMEPTIRQGDILVIDRVQDRGEFTDNKIYVVIIEGMPLVKRVRVVVKEQVYARIISDNGDEYQDIEYDRIQQLYKTLYVIKDFA